MTISSEDKKIKIKELRLISKASMKECQEALKSTNYDLDLSLSILNSKLIEVSTKKSDRETKSGTIGYYSHSEGKILGVVELLSETDFVVKNSDFKSLAKNLATQVIFSSEIKYISDDDFLSSKNKNFDEGDINSLVLLRQPYFLETSRTIKDLLSYYSSNFGEKIEVKNFYRFKI